jgi:integrase
VHRPAPPKARERVLSNDDDAPLRPDAPRPFAAVFRLLLLTGQRLDEVGSMHRRELHDDGTWHLLSERTKNSRAHVVPLVAAMLQIIDRMEGREFVFSTNGRTPPSGWSRAKRRLDDEMLKVARRERGTEVMIPSWRLHDLRRTAVTGMAEIGVPPHVIEHVVNHISGHRAGVAGVYNKSEMLPERRNALERWAQHVQGLVTGHSAKVVPLAVAR